MMNILEKHSPSGRHPNSTHCWYVRSMPWLYCNLPLPVGALDESLPRNIFTLSCKGIVDSRLDLVVLPLADHFITRMQGRFVESGASGRILS
jgi:hypothetical protein